MADMMHPDVDPQETQEWLDSLETVFEEEGAKGPIAKFIPEHLQSRLMELANIKAGDALFFACDQEARAANLAGEARTRIGEQLGLIEENCFRFCCSCRHGRLLRRRGSRRGIAYRPRCPCRVGLRGRRVISLWRQWRRRCREPRRRYGCVDWRCRYNYEYDMWCGRSCGSRRACWRDVE